MKYQTSPIRLKIRQNKDHIHNYGFICLPKSFNRVFQNPKVFRDTIRSNLMEHLISP